MLRHCHAARYNGAFYNERGTQLGEFNGGYARISNTQVIQQNNININIQAPARTIETPQAAGKQPISSAVGKQGMLMLTELKANVTLQGLCAACRQAHMHSAWSLRYELCAIS